jgi:hypothetical protein
MTQNLHGWRGILAHHFAAAQDALRRLAQRQRLEKGKQFVGVRLVVNGLEGEQFFIGDLFSRTRDVLFIGVQREQEKLCVGEELPAERIAWIEADLIDYHPAPLAFDVVIIAYLQLPEQPRRIVTARAVEALAPGGVLLVIGHDLANLTYGTGGPQQAEVLFQPQDVVADIRATDRPLRIVRADTVRRPVDGSDRDAIDALVRAQTLSS